MNDVREQMIALGVDYDHAVERFMGKEELYQRFLKKFLTDESYPKLLDSVEKKEVEEAFKASHAMKGLLANLGMNRMLETIVPIVEVFRAGSMDGIEEGMAVLQKQYDAFKEVAEKM